MGKEWSRNRWNAYRQATPEEIKCGHPAGELVWVGAEVNQAPAAALLLEHGGQIQFDRDGEVVMVNDQGEIP